MGKLKIIQLAFVFLAITSSFTSANYELHPDAADLVRTQIVMEMEASLFYQTYAHYFEHSSQALHGFSKYFYDQSLEEKKHADKLMTYLNTRNIKVGTLSKVPIFCLDEMTDLCKVITGKSEVQIVNAPLYALKDAVYLEKLVYLKLEGVASSKDLQLNHFIEHEYLDEQVESIKELLDLETQVKSIENDNTGLLLLDRWLMDRKR